MKYLYFVFIILFFPVVLFAQITEDLAQSTPTLEIQGATEPNSTVIVTLNDYSSITTVSGILWRVNGVTPDGTQNLRSITVTTPEAGKSTTVEATLQYGDSTKTVKTVITPIYVDLVVEPQTKSPAFYQGRSLPSIGSEVLVTVQISGVSTPVSNLLYTWKLNNTVLNGGAMRGKNKNAITIPMGQLHLLSVDIAQLDGTLLAKRVIEIPSVTPFINFYENNALYGLSKRTYSSATITGSALTVKAEPFHLDLKTYNNPGLLEWEIDNKKTPNTNSNPYEITLTRPYDGFTGTSRVDFHVRNLTQLLQGGKGELELNF